MILDVDATQGYGPETITFAKLSSGSYRYFVYIYTVGGSFVGSDANVKIYGESGLVADIDVPQRGYDPELRYWNVFDIDGETGQITIINTFS